VYQILGQFFGNSEHILTPEKYAARLVSTDPNGNDVRPLLTTSSVSGLGPRVAWGADGSEFVFVGKPATSESEEGQLYLARADGTGVRAIPETNGASDPVLSPDGGLLAYSRTREHHPKFNPKNPNEIICTSGRSGRPQIYKMNLDGADVERLTDGEGEASNAAWHPNGKHIAFAWTRGYEPGNWNIFIMDVSTKQYVQLTNGIGRNENPTWAPDGRHLVFSSNRQGGQMQIWSMLADGTGARPLTTQGRNEMPVWSKQ